MKYIHLFFTFLLFSCNSTKSIVSNTSLCEFDQTISKEEMTFDLVKYNKKKDTIYKNEKIENRYYKHPEGDITNKQTNKCREMVVVF